MKDFEEFEKLLASDECMAEWKEIYDRFTDEYISEGNENPSVFASAAAMRRARFELRKYHEWLNG